MASNPLPSQEAFYFPFLNASTPRSSTNSSKKKPFRLRTSYHSLFSCPLKFSDASEKNGNDSSSTGEQISFCSDKNHDLQYEKWGPPPINQCDSFFGGEDNVNFMALDLMKTYTTDLISPNVRDHRNDRNPSNHIKSCDFAYSTVQRKGNERHHDRYISYAANIPDAEGDFQTVDSKPLMKNKHQQHWIVQKKRMQLRQSAALFMEKSKEEEEMKLGKKGKSDQKKQQLQQQLRYNRVLNRHKAFSEWSIQPLPDWHVEAEIPLSTLPKQHLDASKVVVKDIEWRGTLHYYNRSSDKISPKSPVPLLPLSKEYDFYWGTTSDDKLIQDILERENESIDVVATDSVLACIMSAAQSRYSWHLHLMKFDGSILLDKSNGSIVDLLTVNETANEPPLQDAENRFNRPAALGYEAVKINQNLRLQLLQDGDKGIASSYQNPLFIEPDDHPNPVGYRYRLFTIPPRNNAALDEDVKSKKKGKGGSSVNVGEDDSCKKMGNFYRRPIRVLARTEVNAKMPKFKKQDSDDEAADESYVYICALNEYEVKSQKTWKTQIENQKGALLATEVRNNACKLRKFAASAMMGGCDELRLGFVSRKNANDNEHHQILSVQSYQTKELGNQIGLKAENAWAIVRHIVDLVADKPDGRYVLLKDPLKPVMRLYAKPDTDGDEDEKVEPAAVNIKE